MAVEWEYNQCGEKSIEALTAHFEKFGAEGWELVCVVEEKWTGIYWAFFKRRKT